MAAAVAAAQLLPAPAWAQDGPRPAVAVAQNELDVAQAQLERAKRLASPRPAAADEPRV